MNQATQPAWLLQAQAGEKTELSLVQSLLRLNKQLDELWELAQSVLSTVEGQEDVPRDVAVLTRPDDSQRITSLSLLSLVWQAAGTTAAITATMNGLSSRIGRFSGQP